ncbi:MAG: PrsW family intramembrane metalloprotease [Bacteroidaceae bacterium]|nr:PrsW family intramembrane metalloprotease [Bacteroidaceae bacterium]
MLILLLAAVAPVAVLLYYIYLKDRRCPEPRDMLFRAFRYGIYSTFAVIVLMSPFASSSSPKTFLDALKVSFFEAGIPEEFCKWMALFILVWKSPQFDEYIDGIVYAVFISMGFACLENVMYVVEGGMNVAVSRALLSVPAHFLFAVIMGYYLSMARFHLEKRTYYMACSILLPMLAHGLFDTMAFWMGTIEYPSSYLIAFVVFVLADIWLWRVGVRKIRASVILTDKQHSDEERRSMAQAQEEAERMPVALPVSGEWTDTPIAMYQASAKEHTSEATGSETTFKLLIECKGDAKIFINEKEAFYAREDTNYRLTLPAGEYTVRAVNLNRYEQMVTRKINLDSNKHITIAFSLWERIDPGGRTLAVGIVMVLVLLFISSR